MTIETNQGVTREDTVLVVDDEPDLRAAMVDLLSGSLQDVQVVEAADAQEALMCLQGGGIDLILSDYKMKGLDGLSLLTEASKIAPDVPRVLMTAYGDMDMMMNAINKARIHKFISKPFDPELIVHTVWELLDERWNTVQEAQQNTRSVTTIRPVPSDHPPGGKHDV